MGDAGSYREMIVAQQREQPWRGKSKDEPCLIMAVPSSKSLWRRGAASLFFVWGWIHSEFPSPCFAEDVMNENDVIGKHRFFWKAMYLMLV